MSPSKGADAPQGEGWWLASDGRYYPPELSPGTNPQAKASDTAAPKKKVVKKKAAAPRAADAAPKAGGAPKKKVVKKKVAAKSAPPTPDLDDDLDDSVDLTDKRSGQMKFTARAPASDQIATRRIQAKEQMSLLAGARQVAALRLLAELDDDEGVLAGVGARSLDARARQASGVARLAPSPATRSTPDAPAPAETPAAAPAAESPAPAPPKPSGAIVGPPPVVDRAPAQAPPPDAPPTAAAAPAPVEKAEGPITPHEPERTPAPSARPMGTDVPFMEVRGSAFGTDIDRIGEKILIFADRLEQRDRAGVTIQTIRYDQLATVEVQKKIMGPTLLITSVSGSSMNAKALRPELASGAKAMIEKHADRFNRGEGIAARAADAGEADDPEPAPAAEAPARAPLPGSRTHKSVLVGMLEELHASGILSTEEFQLKRALLEQDDRA